MLSIFFTRFCNKIPHVVILCQILNTCTCSDVKHPQILYHYTYMIEVILQFALGILRLRDALVEGQVDIGTLFAHVVGCLLENSVDK